MKNVIFKVLMIGSTPFEIYWKEELNFKMEMVKNLKDQIIEKRKKDYKKELVILSDEDVARKILFEYAYGKNKWHKKNMHITRRNGVLHYILEKFSTNRKKNK
jgi:hypothetical protein